MSISRSATRLSRRTGGAVFGLIFDDSVEPDPVSNLGLGCRETSDPPSQCVGLALPPKSVVRSLEAGASEERFFTLFFFFLDLGEVGFFLPMAIERGFKGVRDRAKLQAMDVGGV